MCCSRVRLEDIKPNASTCHWTYKYMLVLTLSLEKQDSLADADVPGGSSRRYKDTLISQIAESTQ